MIQHFEDNWQAYLWWLCALTFGYLLGKILEHTVFRFLHRFTSKTENSLDDKILDALAKIAIPMCFVLGIWLAYHNSDLLVEYNEYIKKFCYIISIVVVTYAVARFAADLTRLEMAYLGKELPNSSILTNVVKLLFYIVGLLFILEVLHISIAPALTALGVGGLAVALALQETLGNLFAGFQMILAKKIKPGDYVQLETGEEGFVEDISWRNTTIRALGNHLIIVPNSTVASGILKNYILPDTQNSVLVPMGVSYDSDLAQVEKITIEVAKHIQNTIPGAVPEHEPFIRYNEFGDSSINFNVILRAGDFVSQYLMKHEFIKAIHARYKEEGIDIPFPIRTLYIKKED